MSYPTGRKGDFVDLGSKWSANPRVTSLWYFSSFNPMDNPTFHSFIPRHSFFIIMKACEDYSSFIDGSLKTFNNLTNPGMSGEFIGMAAMSSLTKKHELSLALKEKEVSTEQC